MRQPVLLFLFLFTCSVCASGNGKTVSTQLFVVADAHIHHGLSYEDDKLELSDFAYFEQRGIQLISYPMPIARAKTNDLAAVIRTEIEDLNSLARESKKFRILDAGAGQETDLTAEKLSIALSIEYFNGVFGGKPETVADYRDLGISSITLIDNEIDRFFINEELTPFGKQVIRRMNAAGILVDISHLPEEQSIEVIHFSDSPVISSHSAARGVSGNNASLADPVLDALKDRGGYVFTTFNKNDLFLQDEPAAGGVERFVEHVVYLAGKLGAGHVGIGTDYQAMGKYIPGELNETDVFRQLQTKLREAGFSDEQSRALGSGAFLNAFANR